jgi:hypothetical protein
MPSLTLNRLAGILVAIGTIYITLAAKVYGRAYSLTGLDKRHTILLPDNTPRKGQFHQFAAAQTPYFEAPTLQPPRRSPRKIHKKRPPPPETTIPPTEYTETETQLDDKTEYTESYTTKHPFSRHF